MTHIFAWGNNSKRAQYKGKPCIVLARGRMGSIMIEFENGDRLITSRYAVRKIKF